MEDDFPESVAAYKQYDVLLVNAIFDGMNLVAKEAPLVNERDGVLDPVGEHRRARGAAAAGRSRSTRSTCRSRPTAIHEALEMPADERRARIEAIRAHVREHDVTRWIGAQLADLDRWAARAAMRS